VSLVVLYLRSRQVPVTTPVAVACAVGLSLPDHTAPEFEQLMALFAVAAVVAVAGIALGTPDPALDRTAALPLHRHRVLHLLGVGILAAGSGLLLGPANVVVRNAVGLTGLTALAVVLFGGGLAWSLPLGWTVLTALASLAPGRPPAPLVTWPFQPAGTTAATVTAYVLGGMGVLAYARNGPRLAAGALPIPR
jgi:hypothetical protein